MRQTPNDWPKFAILDPSHWLYHHETFLLNLIFSNGCLGRCMMFLVAQKNVIKQRTVRRKERTSDFKRFGVPHFRLGLLFRNVESLKIVDFFLELNYEADLSADTKVAHAEETYGLQEGKTVQFLFISPYCNQIFELNGRYLHNVPNVESLNPLRLIQKAQDMSHVGLFGLMSYTKGRFTLSKRHFFIKVILVLSNSKLSIFCVNSNLASISGRRVTFGHRWTLICQSKLNRFYFAQQLKIYAVNEFSGAFNKGRGLAELIIKGKFCLEIAA